MRRWLTAVLQVPLCLIFEIQLLPFQLCPLSVLLCKELCAL
jgi:hypothetical protein